MNQVAHIRVEKQPFPAGRRSLPRVVMSDTIVVVGEDGSEIDISRAVTEWREVSEVGEARRLELGLIRFWVEGDKEEPVEETPEPGGASAGGIEQERTT